MENQTIGDRMRLAREAAQLNQSAAARLLGCARQAVWLWETGRTQPEAQSLAKIREIYGADLNWLVCGEKQSDLPDKHSPAISIPNQISA